MNFKEEIKNVCEAEDEEGHERSMNNIILKNQDLYEETYVDHKDL